MNTPDEDPGDELDIDALATQRARADIERLFAEHRIPGRLEGDLFCFDFADLVGRIEILKTPDPRRIHAHMTVSGPKLAVPVLDCWAASGKNGAEALSNAISQWAQGAYWAYHDAFAHDHEPTYTVERAATTFHIFESPLQWYGEASAEALAELDVTRSLVARISLRAGSEERAHRLRWVHGLNGINEVFLDDEPRPELTEPLDAFAWPEKLIMARHSAVMLPSKLFEQRAPANISLGETFDLLSKSSGVVDVDASRLLRSSLQHGIERDPCDKRVPDLCRRWSQLVAKQLRESVSYEPRDVPMSRGLIEAYAKMLHGEVDAATD